MYFEKLEDYLQHWDSLGWEYILRNEQNGEKVFCVILGVLPKDHSMPKFVETKGLTLLEACGLAQFLGEQAKKDWEKR